MSKILIIHHDIDFRQELANFSREKGHQVTQVDTPDRALELLGSKGFDYDVCFLHSDLGEERWNVRQKGTVFRVRERLAPYTRVGIVSGIFPNGFDHVLELKADGYMSSESGVACFERFMQAGPVLPAEQALRGKSVEMPEGERVSPEMFTAWYYKEH